MRDLDRDSVALLCSLGEDNRRFVNKLVRALARDERITEAAAGFGIEVGVVSPAACDGVDVAAGHVCETCLEAVSGGECGCPSIPPSGGAGVAS